MSRPDEVEQFLPVDGGVGGDGSGHALDPAAGSERGVVVGALTTLDGGTGSAPAGVDPGDPVFATKECGNSCERPSDRPWRPRAQPQGRQSRPAPRRDDRLHRAVRLGQVEPGVRHDLRRGPAPLRRVAVGLRPPVPGPDGQARRRLHRGAVAGGLDRPEVDLAQPALDGRHDHRGLRLPAPALRPHRQAALPDLRRADHQADAAADRRPHPRDARGHPLPGARAGHPRAQGRVRRPVRRPADEGLRPGPGRRRRAPAHRAAEAEEAGEAHHRGGRRPAHAPSRRASSASPTRSRPRWAWPAAWSSSTSSTCPRTTRTASGATPSGWPARTTTRSPSTNSSRGRSRSTPRSAPARCAPAWAPARRSTPNSSSPTRSVSLAEGAIAPWATGQTSEYFLRLLQGVADAEGFDLDTPWEQLPARAQKAVLHGTGEQVHVSYRNRYGRDRSYYADYEGVVPWIERRYAETESDYSREKYEGFMREVPCPTCEGTRLKPEILAVTVGGRSIAELVRAVDRRRGRRAARPRAHRPRQVHRRAGAQGDPRPARLPGRRRPALPVPRPGGRDPGRRRGAAHPARHPDRLRPGRRPVRARRAVDRAAPARQPPAHRDARAAAATSATR